MGPDRDPTSTRIWFDWCVNLHTRPRADRDDGSTSSTPELPNPVLAEQSDGVAVAEGGVAL